MVIGNGQQHRHARAQAGGATNLLSRGHRVLFERLIVLQSDTAEEGTTANAPITKTYINIMTITSFA
jgi:hypothetical protein